MRKSEKFADWFTLRIKPEMKAEAEAKADELDVSLAHVVRELIKEWLREDDDHGRT